MAKYAKKIADADNVVTAVADLAAKDEATVLFKGATQVYSCNQDVPFGHKIAIKDIKKGDKIIKYGETIGSASKDIKKGDWVHVHNVKDDYKCLDKTAIPSPARKRAKAAKNRPFVRHKLASPPGGVNKVIRRWANSGTWKSKESEDVFDRRGKGHGRGRPRTRRSKMHGHSHQIRRRLRGRENGALVQRPHHAQGAPGAFIRADGRAGANRTFTTLHSCMSAFSPKAWEAMGIPETFATAEMELFEKRQAIYRRTGFYQTYTCLPMLVGNLPRKGQFISWIGSGAQLLSNSLIGARCNRDGTVINLAAAVTGRAPLLGLFLDENRKAQALVKLEGLEPDKMSHVELGAMGYFVGAKAGRQNVVMDGLPPNLDLDQLKYLLAPLSVSGSVSLCHITGLTPEAPSLDMALKGEKPAQTIVVDRAALDESLSQYAPGRPGRGHGDFRLPPLHHHGDTEAGPAFGKSNH